MANELNMAIFSKRLKEARTEKNMTQKELSEKSGVSTVMISAYERNNTSSGKNPALNNIYAIATALGISIDWLCGLSEETSANKDKTDIDTETFLYSFIKMMDMSSLGFVSIIPGEAIAVVNGIKKASYSIKFNTVDDVKDSSICDFISDYLDVQSLIEKKLLPNGMDKTLIKTIVEKYKTYSIDYLCTGLPF